MLIVLEGLDGAGKSTQVKMIASYMNSIGKQTKYLHFPRFDAPVYGDLIARFLRGEFGGNDAVHPRLVALLFAGDRKDAASLISGWLDEGYCVILDRYVYSNIAFQCAKMADKQSTDELKDWIIDLEYSTFGIPRPDCNIFLDVPIGFVKQRLEEERKGDDRAYLQGKEDIHEADLAFQQKVRSIYLDQCSKDSSFVRIECAGEDGRMLAPEVIFERIKALLA